MGERKKENNVVAKSKNPIPFHAEIGPKNFLSDQSIFTPISESAFTPLFNTNQTRTGYEPDTNRLFFSKKRRPPHNDLLARFFFKKKTSSTQ